MPRVQPWLSRLQPRHWIGLVLVALLAFTVGGYLFMEIGGWAWVRQLKVTDLTAQIQALGPWVFFGALVVLPVFGFPVSPFYLVAGKSFGMPLALTGCLLAVAANVALSFAVARSVMQPLIERLVRATGWVVPQIRPEHQWMVSWLLRVTPGPPFFMQSYLLALGGVPFRVYMIVSVVVSWVLGAAFIIFGESLLSGSAMKALYGVAVVIGVVIGIRLVRQRLQARAAEILPPANTIEK